MAGMCKVYSERSPEVDLKEYRDRSSLFAALIALFLLTCVGFTGLLLYINYQLNQDIRSLNSKMAEYKQHIDKKMYSLTRRINEQLDYRDQISGLNSTIEEMEKTMYSKLTGLKASKSNTSDRRAIFLDFASESELADGELEENYLNSEEEEAIVQISELNSTIIAQNYAKLNSSSFQINIPLNDDHDETDEDDISNTRKNQGIMKRNAEVQYHISLNDITNRSSNTRQDSKEKLPDDSQFKNKTTTINKFEETDVAANSMHLPSFNKTTMMSKINEKGQPLHRIRKNKSRNLQQQQQQQQQHFEKNLYDQLKYMAPNTEAEVLEDVTVHNNSTLIEMDIIVAAHFGANLSESKQNSSYHKGNGRYLHPRGQYTNWGHGEWFENFQMHDHILLTDGTIKVQTAGLYFVYAQMFYSDVKTGVGYTISQNSNPVLQCTMQTNWGNRKDEPKTNTCYTGGIVHCKVGDSLTIRSDELNVHVMLEPSKSFFGLFKIASHK